MVCCDPSSKAFLSLRSGREVIGPVPDPSAEVRATPEAEVAPETDEVREKESGQSSRENQERKDFGTSREQFRVEDEYFGN